MTPKSASLGEIMQLAFVPPDVPAALKYWTGTMGAGPFVALDHVQVESTLYKGEATDVDFSIYVGYWGDLQIEIVEQHNDAKSIYKAWRDSGQDGMHHVCILTDDMEKTRQVMAAQGAVVLQDVVLPGGGAAIYADTGGGPGTMVEVLKPGPGVPEAFAYIKSLSVGWDGTDPVRRLG
jgi:catechol 2,3-dioxygenase-like lactoylglutathione lyase family enzyme